MRIAAIVPIGYLDRMGYQHVWRECLDSIVEFADRTYLVRPCVILVCIWSSAMPP